MYSFKESLAVPQNVKNRVTILPSNSTPRYILKAIENIHIPTKTCSQMFGVIDNTK